MDLEGAETWVDATVVHGVLAGVLVVLGLLWALALWNAARRAVLREEVAGALAAARALGLCERQPGFRPAVVVEGEVGGRPVRLAWTEGLRGPACRLRLGRGRGRRLPPARTGDELRALLGLPGGG